MLVALAMFPDGREWSLDELSAVITGRLGEGAVVEIADDVALRVRAGTTELVVDPQSTPVPWSVLEGPCEEAWYWPEATATIRPHRRHLALAIRASQDSVVTQHLFLTRITALLGVAFGYVGAYWDPASLVHPGPAFSESAEAMALTQLPLRLWISFRWVEEEDGSHSLFTTGLTALGHPEIEIWGSRSDLQSLMGWAYTVANFVVGEQKRIEHGETVATARDRFVHVFRQPSMFDGEREIYRLVLEG